MNMTTLMDCYKKSREMTSYYTKMIQSKDVGEKEKDLIYELLLNNVNASLTIKRICERKFDSCECEMEPTLQNET